MSIKTREDVLSAAFPPAICAAQARFAMHVSNWSLNVKAIRLAQIFISHTSLSALDSPVFCSRKKAAELLQVDVRTITRYSVELEDRGIIDRLPQTFDQEGKPQCMRVKWTQAGKTLFAPIKRELKAQRLSSSNPQLLSSRASPMIYTSHTPAERFSIIVNEPEADGGKVDLRNPAKHPSNGTSQVSRGTNLSDITTPSCKQELSIENKQSHANRPHKIIKATRLPDDILEPAAALQLKRQQICYLFKRCKEAGQRLQDIFRISLDTMIEKGLAGSAAMGWVISLLESGRDFSWAVKQKKIKAHKAEEATRKQQAIRDVAAYLSSKPVLLPNGRWLKEVIHEMAFFTSAHGGDSVGCQPIRELATFLVEHQPTWLSSYMLGEKSVTVQASSTPADLIKESRASQRSTGHAALRGIREVIKHKKANFKCEATTPQCMSNRASRPSFETTRPAQIR